MCIPTFLLMSMLHMRLSAAQPLPDPPHVGQDGAPQRNPDEHSGHRTIVVVICLCFAFALALAQGYRAGRMAGTKRKTTFANVLIFAQGFFVTAFVFAVGVNSAGLGLQTDRQCHAAIAVCITLYALTKVALYLFLLERVYVVRAPFVDRMRDPIWITGAVTIVLGYCGYAACGYISLKYELSRDDGICRIGLHSGAAITIITLDVVINIALTGLFVWQLRPVLRSSPHRAPTSQQDKTGHQRRLSVLKLFARNKDTPGSTRDSSQHNVKVALVRNVVGSLIILVNTIVNITIFLTLPFATIGHACQLMCLTDVALGMLITNWLTLRSVEDRTRSPHNLSRTVSALESNISGPNTAFSETTSPCSPGCISNAWPNKRPMLDSYTVYDSKSTIVNSCDR